MKKKAIIYIPGLNDTSFLNRNLTKFLPVIWKKHGFDLFIIYPHWKEGNSFIPKLKFITDKIDELSRKDYKVYLFGQSAGGSAVLNAFSIRKTQVMGVINICGRLRKGSHVFPSLEVAAKGNPAFAESVLFFENQNEKTLTKNDRKKILTIKPLFDEIVPSSTVALDGATNITIPIVEHSLGGIASLTLFARRIVSFMNSELS